MANDIFMAVTIIYLPWGAYSTFAQRIGNEKMKIEEIPETKASRLGWELKLAGGTRTVDINRFDPKLFSISFSLYIPSHC